MIVMKNFFYLATSVSAISIACAAHADFDDSGTDYSVALAAQEKWAEDAANQFISMPNSFACIIANSGAEVNANGNWTSLIDEVACRRRCSIRWRYLLKIGDDVI
jgi:hypothetical protein